MELVKDNKYFFDFKNDCILSSNIGDMILTEDEENTYNPIIYIKENYSKIKSMMLNNVMQIEMKIRQVKVEDVEPIILMIRIDKNDNLVYGQWFNILNKTDIMSLINLNYTNRVCIRFIDIRNRPITEIIIYNKLMDNIKDIIIPKVYKASWQKEKFSSAVKFINSSIDNKGEMYHSRKKIYK